MASTDASATLGSPPNTHDDYLTIKALLQEYGLDRFDPNMGLVMFGPRPPGLPYESKQPGIIVGMVVVMFVIIAPTATRLRLRAIKQQMVFGPDDWSILITATLALAFPILQIVMVVKGGGGLHTWDVTYEQFRAFLLYGQVCRTIYYVVVGMIKVSITLFFRRLADKASKVWQIMCDFFLATCCIYVLVALFLMPLLCIPPRAYWDLLYRANLDTPPKCIDKEYVSKILGITHVIQGAMMLTVPVAILWTVQINKAKKIRLFLNWFVGAVTVIGSMVKTWYQVFNPDLMWTYPDSILLFAVLDICLGILTASIPVLDALLVSAFMFVTGKVSSAAGSVLGSSQRRLSTAAAPEDTQAINMAAAVHGVSRHTRSMIHHTGGGTSGTTAVCGSDSAENVVSIMSLHDLELKMMRTRDANGSSDEHRSEDGRDEDDRSHHADSASECCYSRPEDKLPPV